MDATPLHADSRESLDGIYIDDLGLLKVTGTERVDLLHRLSTQDLRPLRTTGQVADTVFTTAQGRCVAWARVVADEACLWIRCAASRAAVLEAWIDRYTIMEDVRVENVGHLYHGVQVFGAQALGALGLDAIFKSPKAQLQTVYGGTWMQALKAWGHSVVGWLPRARLADLQPVTVLGADAWHVRRLYAGVPDDAFELKGEVSPLEMRLAASSISWNKGCYIGQEVISRLDSYDKVARLLMGFVVDEPDAHNVEMNVDLSVLRLLDNDKPIGRITSWQRTPEGIVGLAVVKRHDAEPKAVVLKTPTGVYSATLATRPFWA